MSIKLTTSDPVFRFRFDHRYVQGRMVLSQQSVIDIFGHQDYPTPVKKVLGELVAATSTLGATIKFNGAFIRQVKGVRLAMEEEKGSCGLSAGGLLLLPEVI
ncbi:MAG TPA: hypothetical protein EYM43_03990, partial [Alphaproteobacteria bacterium]|nr:hypothetical protein [Alphaproteobacteria bacterium]